MMKYIVEILTLSIVAITVVLFFLSLKNPSFVVNNKILGEFESNDEKKHYVWHQRINVLLYGCIALAVFCIPQFRKSEYILIAVFFVLIRGIYYNKKYLGRWTARK